MSVCSYGPLLKVDNFTTTATSNRTAWSVVISFTTQIKILADSMFQKHPEVCLLQSFLCTLLLTANQFSHEFALYFPVLYEFFTAFEM